MKVIPEVYDLELKVFIVYLITGVLGQFVRSTRHNRMMIIWVSKADPVQLQSKFQVGQVK
jgi:hypothetical protein